MTRFLLLIIISLQLFSFLMFNKSVQNDWCSTEIDVLRTQISDVWFHLGLNDE